MQPSQAISSAAAWVGAALRGQSDWRYHFSAQELAELDAALQAVKVRGLEIPQITREHFPLPTLAAVIEGWRRELYQGRGFLLVQGFPADRYSEAETAIVYWGIGQHLGIPVSQNADGDLLGHVRDTGEDPDDPRVRLYKTRRRQDFHTDGSDLVGLLCLQSAKYGGESQIVSSVSVFNEVLRRRPDLAPLLFQPFYWDAHGQEAKGEKPYWEFPICHYVNGELKTFFVAWYIRNAQRHAEVPRLTPEQNTLIALIEEIAHDPQFHLNMDFAVGDMQFLRNAVILHARGEYEDWPEPERKRHLLRLWLAARETAETDPRFREGIRKREPG